MSPTRRSLITMTTALAGATGAASNAERIAHLLTVSLEGRAVEATFPAPERDNPAAFAWEQEYALSAQFEELGDALCPEQWAAWAQAEGALLRAHPDLVAKGRTLFNDLHDETLAFILAAYKEGVRIGAVIENLRRETLPSLTLCMKCQGYGVPGLAFGEVMAGGTTCSRCKGSGMIVIQPGDPDQHAPDGSWG